MVLGKFTCRRTFFYRGIARQSERTKKGEAFLSTPRDNIFSRDASFGDSRSARKKAKPFWVLRETTSFREVIRFATVGAHEKSEAFRVLRLFFLRYTSDKTF